MANSITKKTGGRINDEAKTLLLANIRDLFQTKEIGDYSERDLSLKFGYARNTIRKYVEQVRLEVNPKNIEATKLKFNSLFEEAIIACESFIKKAVKERRERDARDSIRLLLETIKQQTDFMERFFIKEKVSEKIELQGVIINANVDLNQTSNDILKEIRT